MPIIVVMIGTSGRWGKTLPLCYRVKGTMAVVYTLFFFESWRPEPNHTINIEKSILILGHAFQSKGGLTTLLGLEHIPMIILFLCFVANYRFQFEGVHPSPPTQSIGRLIAAHSIHWLAYCCPLTHWLAHWKKLLN